MQLDFLAGLIVLLAMSIPIFLLALIFHNFLHDETPTTDRIYIWTEELEKSARRLKLRYVSDHNVSEERARISVEELEHSMVSSDSGSPDPTFEPELPFGRYESPQYSFKELTSLGLELWTKRMHAKVDSFNIDKRCHLVFKEAQRELLQIGMTIIDSQETITGVNYSAGIDASGYDTSVRERIIVKVRIFGTKKAPISVVELSVFSRDEEQVITLCEQIKQSLWQ